jgi:hypothetical protein
MTSNDGNMFCNFGLHGQGGSDVREARRVQGTNCREAQVREDCGSTETRAGRVAVLVSRKAALHCLRVTAPAGEGQSLGPPPACRRQSPPAGRRRERAAPVLDDVPGRRGLSTERVEDHRDELVVRLPTGRKVLAILCATCLDEAGRYGAPAAGRWIWRRAVEAETASQHRRPDDCCGVRRSRRRQRYADDGSRVSSNSQVIGIPEKSSSSARRRVACARGSTSTFSRSPCCQALVWERSLARTCPRWRHVCERTRSLPVKLRATHWCLSSTSALEMILPHVQGHGASSSTAWSGFD